jgi:hypothetical protein
MRGISEEGMTSPKFPSQWDVEERDEFYTSISFSGM